MNINIFGLTKHSGLLWKKIIDRWGRKLIFHDRWHGEWLISFYCSRFKSKEAPKITTHTGKTCQKNWEWWATRKQKVEVLTLSKLIIKVNKCYKLFYLNLIFNFTQNNKFSLQNNNCCIVPKSKHFPILCKCNQIIIDFFGKSVKVKWNLLSSENKMKMRDQINVVKAWGCWLLIRLWPNKTEKAVGIKKLKLIL